MLLTFEERKRLEGEAIGEARGEAIGEARGIAIGEEIGVVKGIKLGEAKGMKKGEAKGIKKGEAKAKTELANLAKQLFESGTDPNEIISLIIGKSDLSTDVPSMITTHPKNP